MARALLFSAAIVVVLLTAAACEHAARREPLRELYTPAFARVPPPLDTAESVRTLRAEWRNGGRHTFFSDVTSLQGLTLGATLMLVLLIAWPSPGQPSRLPDLLLLFAGGVPLFGVMRFFDHLREPAYLRLLDWVFTAVVVIGVALATRATVLAMRGRTHGLSARVPTVVLGLIVVALLSGNIALALQRPPDDAGWFVNVGAQRLRERGLLPYGDPLTTGTPAAAYGPLLYLAHIPFQLALSPDPVNPAAPDRPRLGDESTYFLPPLRATQLCAIAFHLVGALSLFAAARRWSDLRTAVAIVALYCGSLAILGVGGSEYSVAGMTFISHIAPAALTIVAVALIGRPGWAGVALVGGAGLGFYPALLGPLWLGYYWQDHRARKRFITGCAIAAALLCLWVVALSRPADGNSRIATIMADTLGHHTDPSGYGRSPFGFWGQREGWRAWAVQPLAGSFSLTSPVWLCLLAYVGWASWAVRGRSVAALSLLAGVTALGFALVKPHATGTYLAWHYPLLLLGLCLPRFTSKT